MNDEIKEILDDLLFTTTLPNVSIKLNKEKLNQLLDYITNLQQAFENSYTEEQLNFAVNEVKEQLKAEHQLTNQLHNEIDKLRVKNYELQQGLEDYKSRCKKAVEYIKEHIVYIDFVKENYGINNFYDFEISIENVVDLLNILNGRRDE